MVRFHVMPMLLPVLLSSTMASVSHAQAELSVDQIIDRALEKGMVGLKQGTATLRMDITNERQEVKSRTLEIKAMRSDDGLLRSMVKFQKPAEVAGIAFLVIEKKDALPDQYVYVPAAKVVRRVAPGNASSSFFGSDIAFIDLMPLPKSERDKVDMKRLPDTKVGDQPVFVIQVIPKVEGAPYGKLLLYVHQTHMVPLKIEFFDGQQKPLKTLKVKKLKPLAGSFLPVEATMKNLQKGTQTDLIVMDPDPNAKLGPSDFTEEAMQR
jgi:Outer membrane lipoprotein-sorting protein